MRKYYKSSTRRPYADFPLVKDARIDKRYYGSSLTNYYTEERGEIREKWFPLNLFKEPKDKQCFALLRRCYALGMLIVNNVDLKSAYSCLRANPKSNWENKIMELLGNPLDLSKYLPSDEPQSYTQETILNLYQLKEIKIINPLPEIVWRDETDEYYWMPHQYSNFIYKEEFDEYVDAELLATLQNKKKMRKRKGMKAQDELRGKDFMKELMNQASGTR